MEQSNLFLKKWQWRIMGTLWVSYALMYFGRVNIAIALPFIEQEFGWTTVTLGIISGSFFWVYALGQLINGILGDRFSARRFVFIGLLGTAAMNLCFGFSKSFGAMILFWSLNGVFQSMGWGPILKTASNWTRPEERNRISAFLGTTFVLGSLVSWFVSGQILGKIGRWELVFWIPGIILSLQALLWVILICDHPAELGLVVPGVSAPQGQKTPPMRMYIQDTVSFLRNPTFLFLALVTIIQGMIKDGINFWTPSLLVQYHNQTIGVAAVYALIIPLFGFIGVLFATWFNHRLRGNDELTIAILFVIGVGLAIAVRWALTKDSILFLTFLIGLCALVINGINITLLSSIPLRYAQSGKTSTLAGFLDFSSYVGSGLMAIVTGIVVNIWGWSTLLWIWVALFGLGGLVMFVHGLPATRLDKKEDIICG